MSTSTVGRILVALKATVDRSLNFQWWVALYSTVDRNVSSHYWQDFHYPKICHWWELLTPTIDRSLVTLKATVNLNITSTVERILVTLKVTVNRNVNSHCWQNLGSSESYSQQKCRLWHLTRILVVLKAKVVNFDSSLKAYNLQGFS